MLSAAEPPERSCPCEVPAVKGDERAYPPERASSSEADPVVGADEAERPHFSLREYVFTSRSKDIGTNWPFSQQHLQVCLKHGVRNLLPPFEPPDLVRARFRKKCVGTEHRILCSQVEEGTQREVDLAGGDSASLLIGVSGALNRDFSPPSHGPVLGPSLQPWHPWPVDKSAVVRAVSSGDGLIRGEALPKETNYNQTRSIPSSVSEVLGSLRESQSISESLSEVEAAKTLPLGEKVGGLCEPSVKKCRLIVKFAGASEPDRTEDTVSNLSSVSDPMASKVCPVCKNFSSTSNTTLNAHIDQCLNVESSAKGAVARLAHHKVKPRKKRSMEDICATAPCCTLEDLDRRNGTNWALEFSIAQNRGISCTGESKRARNSPLKPSDDKREGAVYVDSNGTKILILSKFNDTPPAAVLGCSGSKKIRKECRDQRSAPFGRNRSFSGRYKKYLKANVQRMKMSSFNHLKGKVQKEGRLPVGRHHEGGMMPQVLHAQHRIRVGQSGTLGQWICSKRSSLSKHLNSKFSHRRPRNSLTSAHHISMDGDQSISHDYYASGEHNLKFCKSSDEILSPSETSTDMTSNAAFATGNQGKQAANLPEKNARSTGNCSSTSNSILLKLSKSTGNCVSSAKGEAMDIHTNDIQKSGKFRNLTKDSVNCCPQVQKAKKGSTRSLLIDRPQCLMETTKCNEDMQGVISKRLQKRHFAEKAHKEVEGLPLELVERSHGSLTAHDLGSASNNVTSGMHQLSISESIARPETIDAFGHMSPCQSNTIDSNQADVDCNASERGEELTLSPSLLGAEYHRPELTEFDGQTDVSANIELLIKYSSEKSDGPCSCKVLISEDHEATISCLPLELPREPSGANEATKVAIVPELLGDHGVHPDGMTSDAIRESSLKDDYSPEIGNMESLADVTSIQGSCACLTRPCDKALELGVSSSVASSSSVMSLICNMRPDREPSGSPVSATSAISHLSADDLKYKHTQREPSEEPVVIQEMLRSDSRNLVVLADDGITGKERTDPERTTQNVKTIVSTLEPEQFLDGHPCCCCQRESISCMSKTSRPSVMAGMRLPTKTKMKQMTSGVYSRHLVPSSGVYSRVKSEVPAFPIFDSHSDSISAPAPPYFALSSPAFKNFGLASPSSHVQHQNTSSPILRLMGKDLMVMNWEERPVQQRNQAAPCSSEDVSNVKYTPLPGFSSTSSYSDQDDIQYHPQQLPEGSVLSGQHPSNILAPASLLAEQMECSAGTMLQSGLKAETDSHAYYQKRRDGKPNLSGMYSLEKMCPLREPHNSASVAQSSVPEREVIVIDDSPEPKGEPIGGMQNSASAMAPSLSSLDVRRVRAFSCYPSKNLFFSRELGCRQKPGFPTSCPLTGINSTNWGSTSGSSGHPLPRHFVVPSFSAGQPATSLYYSPSLQ